LDFTTSNFLDVNRVFEELTGYSRKEIIGRPAEMMIAKENVSIYDAKRKMRSYQPSDRYEILWQKKSGEKFPVELSACKINVQGRDIVLGVVRDLSPRKRLERELLHKIEELGYANSRIYALTEKVRKLSELTPVLLYTHELDELLKKTAELLCERTWLAYRNVGFYLMQNGKLKQFYPPKPQEKIPKKLFGILSGKKRFVIDTHGAILPLKGKERNVGIMTVEFDPKEIQVLKASKTAIEGYYNIALTLSEIIGLMIENLNLYEFIKMQSITDELTGIYNRRHFETKLREEIARALRYQRELSLMMIDLDDLKDVNDTHGHPQGDLVLIEVAKLLRSQTREVDIPCRYGGDEFFIIMPETSLVNASQKAELLRSAIEALRIPNLMGGKDQIRVTASIGVAAYTKDFILPADFVRAADQATYRAKGLGRNRVERYG
jgi:diguanylate cyclase (GGDEF)-like protein/PAS domain S-box-containing protein